MAYLRKKAKPQVRCLRERITGVLTSKMLVLDESGYELLDNLLTMNPGRRWTAKEARQSAWFKCEPYPKPPGLEHLSSSHDYEQRQLRKNGGARAQTRVPGQQGQGQFQAPRQHSNHVTGQGGNGRYVYGGAQMKQPNRGGAQMGQIQQQHGRQRQRGHGQNARTGRSRSRSRERSRGQSNAKSGSVSIPPPQPSRQMQGNHSNQPNQPMVMTLPMPSTRPSGGVGGGVGGQQQQHNKYQRRHNNYIDPNPTSGANFYKRYKKPDELKGRSRF